MYVFTMWLCLRVFFLVELAGALGMRLGTPGVPLGAALPSLGHLGGATGHGKRRYDKTSCAMVLGFQEFVFYGFMNYLEKGCESRQESR